MKILSTEGKDGNINCGKYDKYKLIELHSLRGVRSINKIH